MRLQVGLLVFFAFLVLMWATFQSGRLPLFLSEEQVHLVFPTVGGLEKEAMVRLNGVPVGRVREIGLKPGGGNEVLVTLGVANGTRARLHEGASARVTTVGFLSELYVALEGGRPSAPPIRDDSQIAVGVSTDPQVLFRKFEGMSDSLDILVRNLSRAGRKLGAGEGTLGRLSNDERLYDQLVELSRNASDLAARLNESQMRLSERFTSLATSLDSLSWRMQHGEGTMAQLMTSGELHQRLAASTARLDSMLTVIQAGRGSLGRLYADSTLYDDTRALMGSMKRLMAEIEKNPKKYLKFSIF
jgi:phospholipid/cholesterol/gamma-HCH transport system substrate-binding protein